MYRELVIDAAERVFASRGYAGTRMQDVADEAGLAIATVYATIAGKEELYAAIHERNGRVLLARAAEAAQGAGSAFEALLGGVETYVRFLAEHPDYLRIHLNEAQPWALDPKFLCAEQRRQWGEGLELTASVFRAAVSEGTVIDGDPELMARLMIAAHQVYLVQWIEGGRREEVTVLVARMNDHVRRAFTKTK
ncbi:MAG: TetR/AcrR family transcriptional regulator [Polyangiaceae bacterium]|jgi:AcrR family transcriptional regulator|nr:TetR/AcrR family transcriptional regulator [Polyangiaceae bacterium]